MKLIVDANRCQGHTLCKLSAPELIELRDDDGHAEPHPEEVPTGMEREARKAVDSCPEQALTLG